jgi:hypothetical protein
MTDNSKWAPEVQASEESVEFLKTLAEKVNENDAVIVTSGEDMQTEPEQAA